MTRPFCPHIGATDADGKRCDAAVYPSFENRCFVAHLVDPAMDERQSWDQLPLRDQATYCLGESYHLCPRYRIVQHNTDGYDATFAPELLPAPAALDEEFAFDMSPAARPRSGLWVGLASLLLVLLLCGGSLAAYTGWQLVGRGVASLSRRVDSPPASAAPGPVILLVTATSPPQRSGAPVVVVTATATPTFDSPPPVTATPSGSSLVGPVVITTPTPAGQDNDAPIVPELATAVAGALVITQPGDTPPTPTRRPTPVSVVPTNTAGAPVEAGVATTATPVDVTPSVSFRAANQSILPGACTILSWDVENVRAVFLDGEGVPGRGEREVCQRQTSQTYTLMVLRLNRTQETHTVTVEVVPPTVTPTMTPTNTPVLTSTPTWTPEGMPIPPRYGVQITADGGNQKQCTPGERCEVVLLVANTGSLADEMFVNLGKSGPWPATICRDDGGCGDTALSVGMGPGDRRIVILRVDVTAGASGQSYTFQVEALSGNSGRTVSSGQVSVTLRVQ